MLYKALKTFTGLEKMRRGEVKDLKDDYIIKDLLKAGYIEPAEDAPDEDDKPADKPAEDEGVTSEDAPAKEPAKRTRAKRAKT